MELEKGDDLGARFDEDTRLMAQVAGGDAIAFNRLYEKYLPIVTTYLASLNGCRASLEDLAQEVFARLLQSREQFRGNSTVKTYVCGIAKNVFSEQQRRLSKQISTEYNWFMKHYWARSDVSSETEATVCLLEIEEAVEKAMSALTPEQRQAVRVSYFEGKASSKIIAKGTNASTEAFRSRLRRAKRRLYRLLSHLEP